MPFRGTTSVISGRPSVEATTHYNEPEIIAEVSKGLGAPMVGINVGSLSEEKLIAGRGW